MSRQSEPVQTRHVRRVRRLNYFQVEPREFACAQVRACDVDLGYWHSAFLIRIVYVCNNAVSVPASQYEPKQSQKRPVFSELAAASRTPARACLLAAPGRRPAACSICVRARTDDVHARAELHRNDNPHFVHQPRLPSMGNAWCEGLNRL